MIITKEGTIRISPVGLVIAEGFEIEGGSLMDLEQVVCERVLQAAKRLTQPPAARLDTFPPGDLQTHTGTNWGKKDA